MLQNLILLLLICVGRLNNVFGEIKQVCEFVIIIPSYNNEKYCMENLDSVCYQISTKPYQIIYINDCSSDNTGSLVDAYVKDHHLEEKVRVIHNKERLGSGIANIYHVIHNYIDDHKIVVIVDGDDWLAHNNVLTRLEDYYQDPDVWMTHSKLKYIPSEVVEGEPIPTWMYHENKVREKLEFAQMLALRTFKAALFKKVNKTDLFYMDKFMTVAWDTAFCIPMIEMCAPKSSNEKSHYVYIDEILYYYRINTPINDFRIQPRYVDEVDAYIRKLNCYSSIDQLS